MIFTYLKCSVLSLGELISRRDKEAEDHRRKMRLSLFQLFLRGRRTVKASLG